VNDSYLSIGNIGETVFVRKFQGERNGRFVDCTDVQLRHNGKPVTVRLSDTEVERLISLLASSVRGNFPIR
jgi:hypothetical protein